MKKTGSFNTLLILGVILSVFCSFILNNTLLGVFVFIVIIAFTFYRQRAAFIASSAATAYKKGNIEKSLSLYKKAIALKGCSDMTKIVYAYRLISEGQLQEGVKILGALTTDTMDHEERLNYNATQALSIWKQGNIYRAIEIYEALLNDKESELIYETLGYMLIEAKKYRKALEFNLKAVELHESNRRMSCNLAMSYYYLGENQKAANLLKTLIDEEVSFPEPYYYYGLLLEKQEKFKGAFKYWEMALDKKFSYLFSLTSEEIASKMDEITTEGEDT